MSAQHPSTQAATPLGVHQLLRKVVAHGVWAIEQKRIRYVPCHCAQCAGYRAEIAIAKARATGAAS